MNDSLCLHKYNPGIKQHVTDVEIVQSPTPAKPSSTRSQQITIYPLVPACKHAIAMGYILQRAIQQNIMRHRS